MPPGLRSRLRESQDESQAVINLAHRAVAQVAHSLDEHVSIKSHELSRTLDVRIMAIVMVHNVQKRTLLHCQG